MIVGERLQALREAKKLSQGDIEKKTGLLRCYVSRVENGHTVPALETLEKFARALEVPLYALLYDGDKPPAARSHADDNVWQRRSLLAQTVRMPIADERKRQALAHGLR